MRPTQWLPLLTLLLSATAATAQDLPSTAPDRAALVPAGWQIEAEASGDLDADGRPDLALVLAGAGADVITYAGTIGDREAVLELTDESEGAVVGRFSWLADGVDIPLHPGATATDMILLSEEGPCAPTSCARDPEYYDTVTRVPIAASWSLSRSADGTHLTGTRTDLETSDVLAVELEYIGQRQLPQNVMINPATLSGLLSDPGEDEEFNAAALPYEFLKLDVPLTPGAVQTMDGSTFIYVSDPRTRFAFPRIISLADGSDPAKANETLTRQHNRMNLRALACKSSIYIGLGWDNREDQNWGTLGNFDQEDIRVTYLSPRVMSWNQSGNWFCMGDEYPHSQSLNMNVQTGAQLDLTQVIADVSARTWDEPDIAADPALVRLHGGQHRWHFGEDITAWLLDNLEPLDNPPANTNCVTGELITDHIGVHFATDDVIVFALEGLRYYDFMCTRTLLSMPVAQLPPQLAVTPQIYFDELK